MNNKLLVEIHSLNRIIVKSGFVSAFFSCYVEDKIDLNSTQDRLDYVLCRSNNEKIEVTKKNIEQLKSKIIKLGHEDICFSFFQDRTISLEEWSNILAIHFFDEIQILDEPSFTPFLSDDDNNTLQLIESWLPQSIDANMELKEVIQIVKVVEYELLELIKEDIEINKTNGYWEFDFNKYKEFKSCSIVVKIMFDYAKLFFKLNRMNAYYDYLDYEESSKELKNNRLKGFAKTLDDEQIKKLYKGLFENNFIDCSEIDFSSIFSDLPTPIKWKDTSVTHPTKPNKQTIFELFYLLNEFNYITLPDCKADNSNNFFRKLEFIFPDIKNFKNSAGSGRSQKKTVRQKELKTIIESLKP